jgi:ABC-type polysaccharide/polyol phosphate export permease
MSNRSLALAWTLAERDLRARYSQSALGWLWNLAQPLAMALILTLIGHRMNQNLPASSWLAGWVLWNAFSSSWTLGSLSLAHNRELVTKTALPPLSYPLSKSLLAAVDGGVGLVLWSLLVLYQTHALPTLNTLLIAIACLILSLSQGFGLGALTALPTAKWKDVAVATPFLAQFAFLLSPLLAGSAGLPQTFTHWIPGWSAVRLYLQTDLAPASCWMDWTLGASVGGGLALAGWLVLHHWGKKASDWV